MTLIYSFAAVEFIFESHFLIHENQKGSDLCELRVTQGFECVYEDRNITYLDMLYLIMMTLSTVGYGDITPNSELGMLTIEAFII